MKRPFACLLALVLLLALLPGCRQPAAVQEPSEPDPEPEETVSARELVQAALLFSGHDETLNVESLCADEDSDRLAAYIEAVCGLTQDQWEDAAVIRGMGASAFEIIALRLPDSAAARQLETVLTDYLTAREGAFTGYAPAEAEMASHGKIRREGRTVGLFICPAPEGAGDAFTAAYNGEKFSAPPESDPEPDPFVPAFELHDLLHRLLLEAACPEWRSVDKYWTTSDDGSLVSGYWAPDNSGEWTAGGTLHLEDDPPWAAMEYEILVFLEDSEYDAEKRVESLNETLKCQEERYREAGDEMKADLLADARAVSSGRYAALIVSDHTEDAVLLFPRIVNDPETSGYFKRLYSEGIRPVIAGPDPDFPNRIRFTPPGEEDMSIYDTSAILTAWENRDPSGLSGDDREIYAAAEAILSEILQDGMTDLEKETAAYTWLTDSVNYDWSHQDALAETERRSYGPYGGLVNRTAVCLGYAASFQLLMDMSGVECITVVGAAFNSTGDHAWNMVKQNGQWYCVDVTWDANGREQMGDAYTWRYFNITSDEMAKNHQWDYANTPEATAADRGQS